MNCGTMSIRSLAYPGKTHWGWMPLDFLARSTVFKGYRTIVLIGANTARRKNQPMKISPGSFEVELFPEEVNSPDHPYAAQFKEILEGVAMEYDCTLLSFDVRRGTVTFSFDSDELTAEILQILKKRA